MCNERIAKGEETACAWACPVGATRFGSREKLLAIAKRRVTQFPDRYVEYVYGEQEVGGTSILMLSGVPFEELGFRMDLGTQALPELTWTVMSKIPNIVVTGGILLGGISWIIHRRMELDRDHIEQIHVLDEASGAGSNGVNKGGNGVKRALRDKHGIGQPSVKEKK